MKSSRNEPARQRHRQRKKEQCGCRSVPASAVPSESSTMHLPKKELNEVNHFGWEVCGKFSSDPEFERLMQYKEKPDIQGLDDQRSTYVLCLEEGAVVVPPPCEGDRIPDKNEKATQTSAHKIDEKVKKEKKKNLISEFFFTPVKERSRSRSPSAGRSKLKALGKLTDELRIFIGSGSKPKVKKKKLKNKTGSEQEYLEGETMNVRKGDSQEGRKYDESRTNSRAEGGSDTKLRDFEVRHPASEEILNDIQLMGTGRQIPKKISATASSSPDVTESKPNYGKINERDPNNKPTVKFHLDPVQSINYSSEHLLSKPPSLQQRGRKN